MFLFSGMPSAIQSAIMQPLNANLDDNILLSTSKLVDVQPPTTSILMLVFIIVCIIFHCLCLFLCLVGLLATTQDILELEVPSTDDAENFGKF